VGREFETACGNRFLINQFENSLDQFHLLCVDLRSQRAIPDPLPPRSDSPRRPGERILEGIRLFVLLNRA
jgi:hypothetical protein